MNVVKYPLTDMILGLFGYIYWKHIMCKSEREIFDWEKEGEKEICRWDIDSNILRERERDVIVILKDREGERCSGTEKGVGEDLYCITHDALIA